MSFPGQSMGKRPRHTAYVVRKGRKPGVYLSWDECQRQVHQFSGQDFKAYSTKHQAQQAWDAWEQNQTAILSIVKAADDESKHIHESLNSRLNSKFKPSGPPAQHFGLKRCNAFVDLTTSDSDNENGEPTTTQSHDFVDLTHSANSDDGDAAPPTKKPKLAADILQSGCRTFNVELEDEVEVQPKAIRLTPAQGAVVQLALRGHNVFLTGAAGSGKTATLKEILRRLMDRYRPPRGATNEDHKFPKVQVVAPTGIAALPLDGKTTYSFAGWYVTASFCFFHHFPNNFRHKMSSTFSALRSPLVP